jgi:hypothetical protein
VALKEDIDAKEKFEDHEVNTQIRNLKRKVIFLGGAESQYNSATWTLVVGQSSDLSGTLEVLEGGRIVDIAPWNIGFRLVYQRHRYERLFESCIEMSEGTPVPSFGFQAPSDDYFKSRIFGISLSFRQSSMDQWRDNMDVPPFYFNDRHSTDRDIRRYIWQKYSTLEPTISVLTDIEYYQNESHHHLIQ